MPVSMTGCRIGRTSWNLEFGDMGESTTGMVTTGYQELKLFYRV
jgi:hypothetical protein